MSVAPPPTLERPVLQILLVDDDAAFRSGLRLWLNRFPDIRVVADTGMASVALQVLADQRIEPDGAIAPSEDTADDPSVRSGVDLLMVSLSPVQDDADPFQGLDLCQQVRQQYPTLPLLVLSAFHEPVMLAAAQQVGATGYCPRDTSIQRLESVIRQVGAGEPYWADATPTRPTPMVNPSRVGAETVPSSGVVALPGPLAIARRNLRRSGLQQIDAAIASLESQLRDPGLSALEQIVLAGRHRELRASRWVVQRLLATPNLVDAAPVEDTPLPVPPRATPPEPTATPGSAQVGSLAVRPTVAAVVTARQVQSLLLDSVLSKLQMGVQNLTDQPLEIDILREEKRRELLYLTLRQLEMLLSEVRFSQVTSDQINEMRSPILQDLWQAVLTEFFGKYSTLEVDGAPVEVVNTLLQEREQVEREILSRIPQAQDLLAHLLFQTPLVIDGRACAAGNPEALFRAELLLDNLLIQTANAVMQPLLNQFADVEAIKQTFYDRLLMSSREIERFRNNLSWRYRVERYWREPTAIFESQYRLLTFQGRGIKRASIYARRRDELNQLSGLQLAVTLALETRDAIAPRLRNALSVVGSTVIYVLTDVVGRGIGLIGRGILKGIGDTWQDLNQRNSRSN